MTDDDIDPSVASVASVGHTWRSALLLRSGGMCIKSMSGISSYPEGFYILSLGTPLRPAVTRQGSGCGLMLARKCTI